MTKNRIEVSRFKPYQKGHLVAFVNLTIQPMGLTIPNCTYWCKEGRTWVNFPSEKYEDENGETKHRPYVLIEDKQIWQAFQKAACKSIDDHIAENHSISLSEVPTPGQSHNQDEVPF